MNPPPPYVSMKSTILPLGMLLPALAISAVFGETPLVLENEDLRKILSNFTSIFGVPESRDETVPPVNFESPQVHPLDLSEDNRWLAAANTYADCVELFELVDGVPEHRRSIYTGLNPVSVRFRNIEELWVANHVSDSITILEVPSGRVKKLLKTDDEPADMVFSESANKAFVSCSQVNRLIAFDLSDLDASPEKFPMKGEDPRALAVSPDGRYIFAAVFESGNGTTVLGGGRTDSDDMIAYPPNVVNMLDGPYSGVNPPPNDGDQTTPKQRLFSDKKQVSLIVKKTPDGRWLDDNDGDWTTFVSGDRAEESGRVKGWDLVDHDLAILDTQTGTFRYAKGLMNICMAVDVNLTDGTISVVGTEAMNHIRYEPNLKGTFIRVQQATVRLNADGSVETLANRDLNPHLDYSVSTVPQAVRDLSVGDPRAIVMSRESGKAYVAGMGSNNIIVTNGAGERLLDGKTIEVGEGPTGLALNEMEDRLYVLNRFEGSISVVDTAAGKELQRVAYDDPTPPTVKEARKHLFGTHENSGLGQASCASCHVDGRMDRLAWDLGDPSQTDLKEERFVDEAGSKGNLREKKVTYSMSKGPMVTQTLQGIVGSGPFHWRGDQDELADFNVFYETLLGDDERLTEEEMNGLERYLNSLAFPPNPYRRTDHSVPHTVELPNQFAVVDGERVSLPNGDPVRGQELFETQTLSHFEGRNCSDCHESRASGGGGYATPTSQPAVTELISFTQSEFKPSQLGNLHEKVGFDAGSQESLSGFGYLHDGSIDTLTRYLSQPQFEETASVQDVADTIAFLFTQNGVELPAPHTAEIEALRSGAGTVANETLRAQMQSLLFGTSEANLAKAMHAGVGTQFVIDTSVDPALHAFSLRNFLSKTDRSNGMVTLVFHTKIDGKKQTWAYQADEKIFVDDRRETAKIENLIAREGFQSGMITMVHPQMVPRMIGDADSDGLTDDEETRDLDPTEPGIQNPFDPGRFDSTGFQTDESDGFADGLSDYDGDGVHNRQEFMDGTHPLVSDYPDQVSMPFPGEVLRNGNGIRLQMSQIGDGLFIIESSVDLKNWRSISTRPFSGTGNGSFGSIAPGNHYYRLRWIP
jgi:DNA-binding beta-propeller fold protein YncE